MKCDRAWRHFSVLRFSRAAGNARTPRDVRCSSSRWTLPPAEPFPGGQARPPPLLLIEAWLLPDGRSFRPYTQVRRAICMSVSLRASTRVSSGFAPLRHSSPSLGPDRHAHTRTLLRRSRSVGCAPVRIQPISFLAPYGFTHPDASPAPSASLPTISSTL
ncbi:unnamed protein product [Brassica napus]|uniref:(rape) hypothetical protein n=1 Tax=Brassica napus TaxID=3708 RepID=A0A816SMA9_BRANA|nr:unnamed protein product [Brassica napus]